MEKARVKKLKELQKRISCKFKNLNILNQSLTHTSFANETIPESFKDNERFEILGDAVLDVVVTHLLMNRFPNYAEGEISKARAALVNEKRLSFIARKIRLGDYLLLGKGEEHTNGRDKDSILAAAFEALVASIYLDKGFKNAFKVMEKIFSGIVAEESKEGFYKDFKSDLQEYSQGFLKASPRYILTGESGPDHDKIFHVDLLIHGKIFGKGFGKTKKQAEQNAAKQALDLLPENDR